MHLFAEPTESWPASLHVLGDRFHTQNFKYPCCDKEFLYNKLPDYFYVVSFDLHRRERYTVSTQNSSSSRMKTKISM